MFVLPLAAVIAAALVFLPAGLTRLAILAIGALPVLAYLFDNPRLIFYLFTFIMFSNVDIYAPVPLFQLVGYFLVVSFAVAVVGGRKLVRPGAYFTVLVIAFLLLVVQSLVAARNLDAALYRIDQFVKLLLYMFLTVQFVTERREFRVFVVILVIAVVVNNLFPFMVPPPKTYAGPSLLGAQYAFRFEGLLFEPNAIGFLQVFLVPMYFFLMAAYRKPFIAPAFLIGTLLLSVMVLLMSYSRGAFVSFVFLILLLLYLERRNRTVVTIAFILIVLGIVLVPSTYYVRIASTFDFASQSYQDFPIYSRLETSKIALQIGFEHLFLGIGIDNFLHVSNFYTALPYVVHNAFLQIFSELGIFALGIIIAIICHNMRIIRDLMSRGGDGEASQLGRMLLLQHLAVLLNAMFIPAAYADVLWYTFLFPTLAYHAYRPPHIPPRVF